MQRNRQNRRRLPGRLALAIGVVGGQAPGETSIQSGLAAVNRQRNKGGGHEELSMWPGGTSLIVQYATCNMQRGEQ